MSPSIRQPATSAPLLVLVLALTLGGCSKTTKPTGTGDVSGLRLGAFASDRGNSFDIVLWDYEAGAFKSLSQAAASTAAEHHPSISSDGRFIAFQVDRGGGNLDDVNIFDRRTQALVEAANLPGLNTAEPETEPAFSGDGKKLCFTRGGATRRIQLYDSATKQLLPLLGIETTGTYSDYSPAPNFDGSQIAFVSTRVNGAPDIFIYDRIRGQVLGGGRLQAALVSSGDDIDPSFSQSGRFLAFASNRAGSLGGYDVYLLEFTSTPADTVIRPILLANSVNDERHPGVNDAGSMLVFQSDRPGGRGGLDLWNFNRSTNQVEQSPGLNSPGDDIEVSLKWPY